jgi:Zn-dependent oligopeptidase
MRRALLAATLGGLLLSGTACSSDGDAKPEAGTTTAAAAPTTAPTSPPPDYTANTKKVCAKLDKIFDAELEDFGTEIGKMIAYKEAKQTDNAEAAEKAAGKQLKDVGAKIKRETAAAQDPELQQAGAASAAKFTKSATDSKLFDKIKSTKDLDKVLQTQMTTWLTPVAGYCA